MEPLPGWAERLAEAASQPASAPERRLVLPKAATYYAGRTTLVATAGDAEALAQLAAQRPLSHIGFDTEFKYDAAGVIIDADHTWYDPHSVHPLLLSLALAEPVADGDFLLSNFVVDLRRAESLAPLRDLLCLPVPFVGHFAHAELLCLLRLDLPEPRILWDSWVCEKALYLGRHHKKYQLGPGADEAAEALAREQSEAGERWRLSLAQTCLRHGFAHPFAGDKERLARSFLGHPDGAAFTPEQIGYAAADAEAAARLYPPQVAAAAPPACSTTWSRWSCPGRRPTPGSSGTAYGSMPGRPVEFGRRATDMRPRSGPNSPTSGSRSRGATPNSRGSSGVSA